MAYTPLVLSDFAVRALAIKVRAIRPGVEPSAATATIRALLAMGWRPPEHPRPRSETTAETLDWRTIAVSLADAQQRVATAIDTCDRLAKAYAALVLKKDEAEDQRDALARRLADDGCVWPERACTGCATCLPRRGEYARQLLPAGTGAGIPGETPEATGQNGAKAYTCKCPSPTHCTCP